MVTDQEIAKGVETLLRHSDPNAVTSLNGVVQQLEAKLGLDLSHKAGFIRDQINLLLRAHPNTQPQHQPQTQTQTQTQHQPQPHHVPSKDHFALQHHLQYPHQPHQFRPHFALHHHPHPHSHSHHQDLNFRQLQPTAPPHPQPLPQPIQPQPQPQPIQPQLTQQAPVGKRDAVFPQNAATATVSFETPAIESAPVGAKRRGGPGGLNKVCGVSPELQAIVGEPALPRTEIVKQLWAYIRKNNLQDPSNKRKIICDDALRLVFETDCTDMFKMNKLLAKHIIALEPRKESGQAKRLKVDVEHTTETTEPVLSPVIISEALAKFLGTEEREMLDTEVVRRVWEYVKHNRLEDPLNSMVILCDGKLSELLGCDSISAVGITEMLRRHLFKRS